MGKQTNRNRYPECQGWWGWPGGLSSQLVLKVPRVPSWSSFIPPTVISRKCRCECMRLGSWTRFRPEMGWQISSFGLKSGFSTCSRSKCCYPWARGCSPELWLMQGGSGNWKIPWGGAGGAAKWKEREWGAEEGGKEKSSKIGLKEGAAHSVLPEHGDRRPSQTLASLWLWNQVGFASDFLAELICPLPTYQGWFPIWRIKHESTTSMS